jgi:hypothetical protein
MIRNARHPRYFISNLNIDFQMPIWICQVADTERLVIDMARNSEHSSCQSEIASTFNKIRG